MIPLAIRKIAGHLISPDAVKAMREWAKDCNWKESDEESSDFIDGLSDQEIIQGIERNFEGGLEAFLKTTEPS